MGWDRMGSCGMGEGVSRKGRPQAVAHLGLNVLGSKEILPRPL